MKKYKLTEEEIKNLLCKAYIDGASDGFAKDIKVPSIYANEEFSKMLSRGLK
jgi:hypothetical protein